MAKRQNKEKGPPFDAPTGIPQRLRGKNPAGGTHSHPGGAFDFSHIVSWEVLDALAACCSKFPSCCEDKKGRQEKDTLNEIGQKLRQFMQSDGNGVVKPAQAVEEGPDDVFPPKTRRFGNVGGQGTLSDRQLDAKIISMLQYAAKDKLLQYASKDNLNTFFFVHKEGNDQENSVEDGQHKLIWHFAAARAWQQIQLWVEGAHTYEEAEGEVPADPIMNLYPKPRHPKDNNKPPDEVRDQVLQIFQNFTLEEDGDPIVQKNGDKWEMLAEPEKVGGQPWKVGGQPFKQLLKCLSWNPVLLAHWECEFSMTGEDVPVISFTAGEQYTGQKLKEMLTKFLPEELKPEMVRVSLTLHKSQSALVEMAINECQGQGGGGGGEGELELMERLQAGLSSGNREGRTAEEGAQGLWECLARSPFEVRERMGCSDVSELRWISQHSGSRPDGDGPSGSAIGSAGASAAVASAASAANKQARDEVERKVQGLVADRREWATKLTLQPAKDVLAELNQRLAAGVRLEDCGTAEKDPKKLVSQSSGGKALRGINPNPNFWKHKPLYSLLKVPERLEITRTGISTDYQYEFDSKEEASDMALYAETCGISSAASDTSGFSFGFLGLGIGSQTTKTLSGATSASSSGVRKVESRKQAAAHVRIKAVSEWKVTLPGVEQLCLSGDAIRPLKKLYDQWCMRSDPSCQTIMALKEQLHTGMKTFYEEFNSHIQRGPVEFGGLFMVRGMTMSEEAMSAAALQQSFAAAMSAESSSAGGFAFDGQACAEVLSAVGESAGAISDAAQTVPAAQAQAIGAVAKVGATMTKATAAILKSAKADISSSSAKQREKTRAFQEDSEHSASSTRASTELLYQTYGGPPTQDVGQWTSSLVSKEGNLQVISQGSDVVAGLVAVWDLVAQSVWEFGHVVPLVLAVDEKASLRRFLSRLTCLRDDGEWAYYTKMKGELDGNDETDKDYAGWLLKLMTEATKADYGSSNDWVLMAPPDAANLACVGVGPITLWLNFERDCLLQFADYMKTEFRAIYGPHCFCPLCERQFLPSQMLLHRRTSCTGDRLVEGLFTREEAKRINSGDYELRLEEQFHGGPRLGLCLVKEVPCILCHELVRMDEMENHRLQSCTAKIWLEEDRERGHTLQIPPSLLPGGQYRDSIPLESLCQEAPENFAVVNGNTLQRFIPLTKKLAPELVAMLKEGYIIRRKKEKACLEPGGVPAKKIPVPGEAKQFLEKTGLKEEHLKWLTTHAEKVALLSQYKSYLEEEFERQIRDWKEEERLSRAFLGATNDPRAQEEAPNSGRSTQKQFWEEILASGNKIPTQLEKFEEVLPGWPTYFPAQLIGALEANSLFPSTVGQALDQYKEILEHVADRVGLPLPLLLKARAFGEDRKKEGKLDPGYELVWQGRPLFWHTAKTILDLYKMRSSKDDKHRHLTNQWLCAKKAVDAMAKEAPCGEKIIWCLKPTWQNMTAVDMAADLAKSSLEDKDELQTLKQNLLGLLLSQYGCQLLQSHNSVFEDPSFSELWVPGKPLCKHLWGSGAEDVLQFYFHIAPSMFPRGIESVSDLLPFAEKAKEIVDEVHQLWVPGGKLARELLLEVLFNVPTDSLEHSDRCRVLKLLCVDAIARGKKSGIERYLRHAKGDDVLETGATSIKNELGNALLEATRANCADLVGMLVEVQAEVNAQCSAGRDRGDGALHLASDFGHEKLVSILLEKHASLDMRGANNSTALMRASKKGHRDAVTILLKHKAHEATIKLEDADGATALILASMENHGEVVQLLLEKRANIGIAIIEAAVRGGAEAVRILLENRASTAATNWYGETALQLAIQHGHAKVAQLLLDENANVKTKNIYGNTPLVSAVFGGHVDVAQLLLERRAEVDSPEGLRHPLCMAAERGHTHLARLLLQFCPTRPIEIVDKAATCGHRDIVQILVGGRADVNAKFCGEPILTDAARYGLAKKVRILLENRASTAATDSDGKTALQLAIDCGHGEVVQLLSHPHLWTGDHSAHIGQWQGGFSHAACL